MNDNMKSCPWREWKTKLQRFLRNLKKNKNENNKIKETEEEKNLEENCFREALRKKLEKFNYELPVEDHKDDEIPTFPKRTLDMRRNATFEETPGLVKDCLLQYQRNSAQMDDADV